MIIVHLPTVSFPLNNFLSARPDSMDPGRTVVRYSTPEGVHADLIGLPLRQVQEMLNVACGGLRQ